MTPMSPGSPQQTATSAGITDTRVVAAQIFCDLRAGEMLDASFDRRTARLHTVTGEAVIVDFPAELADEIQDALREPAAFEGVITFDPATTTVKRVELRRISIPETLPFDSSADDPPLRLVHPDQ